MAIDEVLQQRILSSKSCVTDTISVTAEIAYLTKYWRLEIFGPQSML
jgi:hypothetical protein